MNKIVIGIIAVLFSSPVFGQGYTYAPVDSLSTLPLTKLDSLYPSAFSTDSASDLTTISRPEFDSIFSIAIRPVILELMKVSEEIKAPASSFSYLFHFNANGVLDHARINIILTQKNHSFTIEYPDSILGHLLSNFSLGFSATRAYSQCGSTYLEPSPHIPVLDGPKRYLLAYQPGKAQTVYGIAIGIVGHDVICNAPYNQTTNGLNLQIGGGLFHWYNIPFRYKPDPHWLFIDFNTPKSITNGLQCSIFGT